MASIKDLQTGLRILANHGATTVECAELPYDGGAKSLVVHAKGIALSRHDVEVLHAAGWNETSTEDYVGLSKRPSSLAWAYWL